MPRIVFTLGCLLCCCFPAPFSAGAAPLVLQDKEAGYSISFPDGWETAPVEMLSYVTDETAEGLGIADPDAGKTQGATFMDQKAGEFKMYVITSFSLDSLDAGSRERFKAAARGDAQTLNKIKTDMEEAAAAMGTAVLDSALVDNGYCQSSAYREAGLPAGQALFQRTCVRFAGTHALISVGMYPGPESEKFDKNFQNVIDAIRIAR